MGTDTCVAAIARIGWAAVAKQAHADRKDKLTEADVFKDEAMEKITG